MKRIIVVFFFKHYCINAALMPSGIQQLSHIKEISILIKISVFVCKCCKCLCASRKHLLFHMVQNPHLPWRVFSTPPPHRVSTKTWDFHFKKPCFETFFLVCRWWNELDNEGAGEQSRH